MVGLGSLIGGRTEAKIRYLDGDFTVISPGHFVYCAVTGDPINIDQLKYWSVKRQEAYKDAMVALIRYCEVNNLPSPAEAI